MSHRIFVAQPTTTNAQRNSKIKKWVVRSIAAGFVFVAGLTMGHVSTLSEDHKQCSGYHYNHNDYRADVQDYGQKVADYNEGFATAMQSVCDTK